MDKKDDPIRDVSEPDASFYHARVKVAWADQNLQHLNASVNGFIENHAGIPLFNANENTRRVVGVGVQPPIEYALLASDIIHSLRSALDCCWTGLKRAADKKSRGGTLPRGRTRDEVKSTLKGASIEVSVQGSDQFLLDILLAYEEGNEVL